MSTNRLVAVERLVCARALAALSEKLRDQRVVEVAGLWGSAVSVVTAGVERRLACPVLVICGHLDEADDLANDMELFHGRRPDVLPALELAGSLGKGSDEGAANRLKMVRKYCGLEAGAKPLVVAPIQALMQSVPSRKQLEELTRGLKPGDKVQPEKVIVWLADHGYNRLDQVEVPGDFAVRGGIIDIYIPGDFAEAGEQVGLTVRLDFFDDELESIKVFDLDTLGSKQTLERVELIDLTGKLPDAGESVSFLSYLPEDTVAALWAPLEIAEQARSYYERLGDVQGIYRLDAVLNLVKRFARMELSQFGQGGVMTEEKTVGQGGRPPLNLPPEYRGETTTEGGRSTFPPGYRGETTTEGGRSTFPPEYRGETTTEGGRSTFPPGYRGETTTEGGRSTFPPEYRGETTTEGGRSTFPPEYRGETTTEGGRSTFPPEYRGETRTLAVRSLQKFETDLKKAFLELKELAQTHDITILCENTGELQRFSELLDHDAPGLRPRLDLHVGYVHRGFVWEDEGRPLAFFGHHELFHRYEMRRKVKKVIASRPVDSFIDLQVGDYVVHVAHGIAKFTGIQTINKEGKSEEYLTLRFAENASLHVPANRVNLIQKYVGGFHGTPKLSRLGSGAWEKEKAKVSEAVMDMAAELLDVQASRNAELGTAFGPDSDWQKEFEAEFPYEPTADQITGADEIKGDMVKSRPMDRLLCGDVGYGKTELAMRAAFKCVEHGKQVAVLVPTTVLAEQHYRTFRERMANYPFHIECLSRFRTPKQQKKIIERTIRGDVDVVIGTHRLLSDDVRFKDIGLVVIDEEQRFGVTHKERLKRMRATVDVLTMSATPIPRTLHMSIMGLRDISSLTTAPQDRRSVVTEVMPFDKVRIQSAIMRELNREGQIYFVHNRITDLKALADMIQHLVPGARVVVGHGQMEHEEMETAMMQFIEHQADVLVSTTIIESGLDIPNANTMFINMADHFGLSELHQLRGRVGRWKHRAYCYLLLPQDRPVMPVAAKRLKAIEEYSHLGAGFKIAMRDLEIRGAGNILGPEQSGHIATVGYEMYCQLLEEATRQLKKEPRPPRPDAHVEIGVAASIPKTYIPQDRQRLDAYRRISRCETIEMVGELMNDLKDAFGEAPKAMLVMQALTELRLLSGHFGVESIVKQPPDVIFTMRDAQLVQKAMVGAPGTLRVVDEKTLYFRPPTQYLEGDVLLMVLRNLMKAAYERQQKGLPDPAPAPVKEEKLVSTGGVKTLRPLVEKSKVGAPSKKPERGPAVADLEKLVSLYQAGILTEEEFEAAKERLMRK